MIGHRGSNAPLWPMGWPYLEATSFVCACVCMCVCVSVWIYIFIVRHSAVEFSQRRSSDRVAEADRQTDRYPLGNEELSFCCDYSLCVCKFVVHLFKLLLFIVQVVAD